MKKRLSMCLMLSAVLLLTLCVPAFADNGYFSYSLKQGAASSYSAQVLKSNATGQSACVYPTQINIGGAYKVSFRVRTSSYAEATGLYVRDSNGSFNMWYDSGSGIKGNKYVLAAQAPSSNPANTIVVLSGNWTP